MVRLPTGGNRASAKIAAAAHVPSTPASRPQRIETAVITARNRSNSIVFESCARKSTQETPAMEQQINTPKNGFRPRERVRVLCIEDSRVVRKRLHHSVSEQTYGIRSGRFLAEAGTN